MFIVCVLIVYNLGVSGHFEIMSYENLMYENDYV